MSIIINEENRAFTLQTKNTTYQMKVGDFGYLLHTYYGEKLNTEDMSYLLYEGESYYTVNPYDSRDRTRSLEVLPQEYSTRGNGDLRSVSLEIMNQDGTYVCDLKFKSVQLINDRLSLETLPTCFAMQNEIVNGLIVTLEDQYSKIEVELLYSVYEEKDIITRAAKIINNGKNNIKIKKAQSINLDFVTGDFDIIHFQGRWSAERTFERLPLKHNRITISSNYGTTSHAQNPGIILCDQSATEEFGNCYGVNLVYSGNFRAEVEKTSIEQTRFTLGVGDESFCWNLEQGQFFETPEAVLSYSHSGLGGLSRNFHKLVRNNVCKSKFNNMERPVLLNSWETTLYDFSTEKLVQLAKDARKVGVNLLVMDDGWFGNRFDDNRALGDWTVNETKLGTSFEQLVKSVNQEGLDFGIWFEPEMVSEDSDFYEKHPEWVLKFPVRKPLLGRNQLVLDMSNPEVVDELYSSISKILDSSNVKYLKWDMNRPLADWYSPFLSSDRQGELQHRYILGLYNLLERLTSAYPDVLFEGCSAGGARFDLGMLVYQPQIWASDNTDPINRLKIQHGTSFFYPLSTIGAHITSVPSGANGRTTPLKTRAHVAMAGTFGYEMNIATLNEIEQKECLNYTNFYKKNQELIFNGDYYRLSNPNILDYTAWQIVSEDKLTSLVTVVFTDVTAYSPFIYLKLHGLKSNDKYTINNKLYFGSSLMNAGLKVKQPRGNYPSCQFLLTKVDD